MMPTDPIYIAKLKARVYSALAFTCLGMLMGLGLGWKLRPVAKPLAPDVAAPAQVLPGGAVLLERAPAPLVAAKGLPKGAAVERRVTVTVVPKPLPPVPTVSPGLPGERVVAVTNFEKPVCPPVEVTLDLVKMSDQHLRVMAYSSDGDVVNGMDIPAQGQPPISTVGPMPTDPHWAAALTARTVGGGGGGAQLGAMIQHTRGPFVLLLEAIPTARGVPGEVRAGVGLRW